MWWKFLLVSLFLFMLAAASWQFHRVFMRGRIETIENMYFHPTAGRENRNSPFAALPSAFAFAAMGICFLVAATPSPEWLKVPIAISFAIVSMMAFAWGLKRLLTPGERGKPEWLKLEELRRRNEG